MVTCWRHLHFDLGPHHHNPILYHSQQVKTAPSASDRWGDWAGRGRDGIGRSRWQPRSFSYLPGALKRSQVHEVCIIAKNGINSWRCFDSPRDSPSYPARRIPLKCRRYRQNKSGDRIRALTWTSYISWTTDEKKVFKHIFHAQIINHRNSFSFFIC